MVRWAKLTLMICWLAGTALSGGEAPLLVVEAPPQLAAVAQQVERIDRRAIEPALRLTGLEHPGEPIRLLLAPEGSPAATSAPSWVAGYAHGEAGVIVILPARVPTYPDRNLLELVQHEVAHVLVARAAHGRPVPRWFNEGVAVAAARGWRLEDRARLAAGLITGEPTGRDELDAAFHSRGLDARPAYALSGALVRAIERRFGPQAPAAILSGLAADQSFEQAFAAACGTTIEDFERSFWRRQSLWNRWVPLLTSSGVAWFGITLLAVAAFRRRRQRDAERMARWEEEERRTDEAERLALAKRVEALEDEEELVN